MYSIEGVIDIEHDAPWHLAEALAVVVCHGKPHAQQRTGRPRIEAEPPDCELRCRAAVASTLLAGLELARVDDVTLEQGAPWLAIALRHQCYAVGP